MRLKQVIFLIFLITFSFSKAVQVKRFDTQSKIKAIFIANFARYIEWGKSYRSGDFIIKIYGNSPVYKSLNIIARNKSVNSQQVRMSKYSSSDPIGKTHIIFVSKETSFADFKKLREKYKKTETIFITEKKMMLSQGSHINFAVVDNKQKYEINKTLILKQKLKMSTNLEKLAYKII